MRIRSALLALAFAALAAPAWAAHCPLDMKAIDEALSKKPSLATAQLEEVTRLRAEGEAAHKAGKHGDSVEALGKARKILGI
jgi:hypothetical protein